MIILVLLIGGAIYLRTISNAESLDNRNLRELSRIGQGVEGRVNNLRRVLNNLSENTTRDPVASAEIIPHLSVHTPTESDMDQFEKLTAGTTAFKTDLAASSLNLWHVSEFDSTNERSLPAVYSFDSLRPTLSSEYIETIFLANENGDIFIWETDRTGVRIHELAALDTLQFKDNRNIGGIGKSDILQASIAGQEYRFYLLPIRIHLSEIQRDSSSESEYTNWILGGLIPQTEFRQQSLSLDPNMALFLGFLVIAGFLIVPFIRIFTMGTKERLKVGNLFYLVIALIFGSGLAGLWMADVVHFSPLKKDVNTQLKETAYQMALNIDSELDAAIQELTKKTNELNNELPDIYQNVDSIKTKDDADTTLMKVKIPFDNSGTYPYYHMVFWTDSNGEQIAKWTPRSNNTPRINVDQREYFLAIRENRGWDQKFHTTPNSSTCTNMDLPSTGKLPYYVESIRSWTTGENLAAISVPWESEKHPNETNDGIAAITTELASLSTPVLPAGVGFAIVDTNAQTLFHSRPERILDENFAEETSNGDLLRSILAARSCMELELSYEGQNKLMVIQPLNERPLYLILFKDISLIDTVRFEAWFEGGALFGLWVLMILLLIFILDRLPSLRMDWLWPDIENPGKYTIFTIYSISFIVLLFFQAVSENHLHIHPAMFLIPVIYLGLGLVILTHDLSHFSNNYKSIIGWLLFAISFLLLIWLTILNGLETTRYELLAIILSLTVIWIWLRNPRFQKYIDRWSNDLSLRGVYTAAMVSGLLVLGLLPGYITYRFTFHDHSEHLVKYHQLELAESLQNRKARINKLMQDTWEIENWWELTTLIPKFSDHNYDLAYENLIFRTSLNEQLITSENHENGKNKNDHGHPETDLHDSMHGLLGNHIPFLTDASIRMRQLSSQQADRSWISDQHNHKLQYTRDNPGFLTSQLPVPHSWFNPWRITMLLAIIAALCLIVYRVSRWVFFVHLEHSDPLTLEDVLPKPGEAWRSTIFVGTRSISRQPLLKRSPEIHYIDLIKDVDKDDDIKVLLIKPLPDETKVLCFDHFDHRIDEIERSRNLLELLEKNVALNQNLPVVLLTSKEPDETLLTANIEEEMKHRWDRVLGRFSKVILSDYVSKTPFEVFLQIRTILKIEDDLDQLMIELGLFLKSDFQEEKQKHFSESLAELALKTNWLFDELQYLSYTACNLTMDEDIVSETIKKQLEKTIQNIENLAHSLRKEIKLNQKQAKWLHKVSENAVKVGEQIDNIERKPKNKQDLPDENQAIARLSPFQFFKKIPIWLLFDSEMEARRVVYRDKRRIRMVYQTLVQECGHHQRLQEIGQQLTYRPDWHSLTKEEITDLVREGAEAHYRARWAILSKGERLIAAQLSRGAVVNPKSHRAISRLFARGLIRRSPELRLDNTSFSDFVKSTVSEDQLHGWEKAGIPSTWEMIRAPLVIALIIIALFLFWSQQEFMGNTVAFLGTIAVGIGAVFNLLSKLGNITGSPDLKNLDN